ncbi:MAG: DNA polymerase I [Cellulosilyticaceae bacterium]
MTKRILLLDGLSIANRAFYGIPLLSNKNGTYTNAVYGFLNIMLSMIEKEKPDLLGVAFDVSAPTFRHTQFESYKGTRKGMPEELRGQIPVLKQVLDLMGIHRVEQAGYEADDLLGTLAKKAEAAGHRVVVVSGDRDLLQITSEQIELKIPKTKMGGTEIESYFAKDVTEKYEVTPLAFIDVKGLMGDTSDNIPGVPGVGEKTAIKLIKEYGSMENLYEHLDEVKQKKLNENLTTYREQAFTSKMLATIVCDVDMGEIAWGDFDYTLVPSQEALAMFKELELKKLIAKLPAAEVVQSEGVACDNLDGEALRTFVAEHKQKWMGLTYLEEGEALSLRISDGEQMGVVCVADHIETVTEVLADEQTNWVINDSKKLRHVLGKKGISIQGDVFDVYIAAYLLSPTDATYTFADLMDNYLDHVSGQADHEEALYLVKLHEVMKEKLEAFEMLALFEEIEMPLVEVLYEMEHDGIKVDKTALEIYGKELEQMIASVEQEVYATCEETFNINSPKQLGVILFEKMGIPPIKKTKTGYSTAAEVLEKLKDEYPVVEKILEYRQYVKLKSTYVDGLLTLLTEEHKIHSTFNQTVTATGRISSTEPNLQNIPIRMPLGRQIRKVFVPSSDEYIFLDADYSQIELRVLAAIAEDEKLIHAFTNDLDIHTLTASEVFHTPFDEVTPLQRSNAKAVNFGIVYGISAFALADDLKISQKEADAYINGYFEKYPAIKRYLDQVIGFAKMHGYVETIFHRRREIPEMAAKNFNMREFGKRVAMNTPIQGAAADIIKIAMIRVSQALKKNKLKSKLILTVHDELLLEVYKPELEQVAVLLKYEMEHAVTLAVPLSVDVHSGTNWLEAK